MDFYIYQILLTKQKKRMDVYGFQKLTLLDYPNHIASTVFVAGCNFFCPFCHNPELVFKDQFPEKIDEQELFDFFEKRKGLIEGVCITGGEPTIQTGLKEFIKKIRALNYLIKLDTNGYNPEVLKGLLEEKLLDYVAMDIKFGLDKYKIVKKDFKAENITESIKLIQEKAPAFHFRTTVVPTLHDQEQVRKIGQLIKGTDLFVLQNFKASKSIDSKFDKQRSFTEQEMQEFKKIMEEYVKKVKIS